MWRSEIWWTLTEAAEKSGRIRDETAASRDFTRGNLFDAFNWCFGGKIATEVRSQ